MSFAAYNATLRNVIRDLPTPYQTIVNDVCNATHDCSLLALGSCNTCTCYLAFRYGNITRVHAPTDEFNFMKELSLSFHAACSFIKDRHITPQIRRAQENKAQVLRNLPRETSNAPCNRPHLADHQCPEPQPCQEPHLSEHTCPECEEEHLADHECPAPHVECNESHLADHTCSTQCNEPHLTSHQCPVITRDPLGHVCYHLECLGPCRVNPDPRVPQENIPNVPGAYNSFSSIVNTLDQALATIVEDDLSESASTSTTVRPPLITMSADPTLCPTCQHEYRSRHHRYECANAVPRSSSPVLSEPETTTSMSSSTRRIVRHRRRTRNTDGSYTFDGRRLPHGMSRPLSISANQLASISNLDHSESSEEEVEIEAEPTDATADAVTQPTFVTNSSLFRPIEDMPAPTTAPTLPPRSMFQTNPEFRVAQPDNFVRAPTLRDFAPPRTRTAQSTTFGLTSPAPSSSSSSSGLFSVIPSYAEFQAQQQEPADPQAQARLDLEADSD